MQVYSEADLILNPVPTKSITLGALTQGFTVTNYSDVAFKVSSNTVSDLGTIPPYFARTLPAKPSDTIMFMPTDLQTVALPQTVMFLNVDESGGGIIPSQTPLAQLPGYAITVQGNVGISGVGQVAIQGTPTVAISGGVNATIANASIKSDVTNALISTNPTMAPVINSYPITIAAGATQHYFALTLPFVAYLDEITFNILSLGNHCDVLTFGIDELDCFLPSGGGILWNIGPFTVLQTYLHPVKDAMVYNIKNISVPTSTIEFWLKNSGATTLSDTITVTAICKYASMNTKAVANDIIHLPVTTTVLAVSSPLTQLVAPDATKNLKELHLDIYNATSGNNSVHIFLDSGGTKQVLSSGLGPNANSHNDLMFGTGVPLDGGIYGSANVSGGDILGGYAIVQTK